jgi:hypothetical protein
LVGVEEVDRQVKTGLNCVGWEECLRKPDSS